MDAAIKLNIPHSGWTYQTRKTDDGVIPEKYSVKELAHAGFSERIERNVLDSDAALIITHGGLTIGLKIVRDHAEKHRRPHLHVDLNENPLNRASALIRKWMINNDLEAIYVTGSKSAGESNLAQEVIQIIEGVCRIESEQEKLPEFSKDGSRLRS